MSSPTFNSEVSVKNSLDLLSKKWEIDPKVYDLHLGKRNDVVDTIVNVDGVLFHIPTLNDDGLYVLWKCLCGQIVIIAANDKEDFH
ncbi:MAG: hypothetical protein K0S67_1514 [Nitrososphaeraceae archaeon]|nr:hypothetical protein [Nitrososphaeraceae archaeon]